MLFGSMSFSDARLMDITDRLHVLTAEYSFDFFTWTFNAVWVKLTQSSMVAPHYFDKKAQHKLITEYLSTLKDYEATEEKIKLIYSDPSVQNPSASSVSLRNQLSSLSGRMSALAPFAEAVLEMQVTTVINDLGLTSGGQPLPWVLYHSSALPQNLVISLRQKIGQQTNFVLTPITVERAANLETRVDKKLNVSSLVVDIGGLAAYPTMIMFTPNLAWLTNTIAHEWAHIYLGQRPLGNNYDTPETRTMNETTASIAGTEIGQLVMKRYFPELLNALPANNKLISLHDASAFSKGVSFDFRTEMHTTRIHTDELLAQGKVEEAEAYMEQRRKIMWDNNYAIRKLNQAYFAFYGAYADTPGGAAGEDPVGPAVRALRSQSSSLKEFLDRISRMTSFSELQKAVGKIQ